MSNMKKKSFIFLKKVLTINKKYDIIYIEVKERK